MEHQGDKKSGNGIGMGLTFGPLLDLFTAIKLEMFHKA
jgi:hypothetical protein